MSTLQPSVGSNNRHTSKNMKKTLQIKQIGVSFCNIFIFLTFPPDGFPVFYCHFFQNRLSFSTSFQLLVIESKQLSAFLNIRFCQLIEFLDGKTFLYEFIKYRFIRQTTVDDFQKQSLCIFKQPILSVTYNPLFIYSAVLKITSIKP